MRFFRQPTRPRLLGERRPLHSPEATGAFVRVGAAADQAVNARTEEDRAEALRDLEHAFTVSRLYANDTLLSRISHYCLTVQDYARGDADRGEVVWAREEFFAACREALGTND